MLDAIEKQVVNINQQTLEVLIKGIMALVEGQLHFADEFGINYNRVFPNCYEQFSTMGVSGCLRNLLVDNTNNVFQIERLFVSMRNHQLSFIEALDAVALQSLGVIARKKWRLQNKTIIDYEQNQAVRFRDMIVPGVMRAYMKYIEEGRV